MSRKPSKPETRIEDYLDVMTGGNAALPQPILRIEFYYAFLAGMAVELPQPILDDEKLLAKICGMEVEAPTYIPGISPRLYAYMAKKGGQDVEIPQPVTREEMYWFDYCGGTPTPSVQEYTGAVPVTFVADGTPLLDYIISGNTAQSGTPTPENPIMPQGTGERTGNLLDYTTVENTTYATATQISGGISVSGRYYVRFSTVKFTVGNTYTMSWKANTTSGTSSPSWRFYYADNTFSMMLSSGRTLIAEKEVTELLLYVSTAANCVAEFTEIMLNSGSTPLPYEPYGYKIPISSANTTTPVYLGEVETTRKIKKLVLTGEENWALSNNRLMYTVKTTKAISYESVVCTHFISAKSFIEVYNTINSTAVTNQGIYVNSGSTDIADFKSYLAAQYAAGTPVTVWYVLATEETAVVNDLLMRIGDYADTLSMEQAGVEIPTASGSTTLDVATTVPPSEVYIKYRGEAVATLSALPAEVSSPEETPEEVNPEETEEEENER